LVGWLAVKSHLLATSVRDCYLHVAKNKTQKARHVKREKKEGRERKKAYIWAAWHDVLVISFQN